MKAKATRESWTNHPLPNQHVELTVNWRFTKNEFKKMINGLIPQVMEDKWFIYFDSNWLYFHRSWTGFCIYKALIEQADTGHMIRHVLVSREAEQYRESNDEFDLNLLKFLIENLLLGKHTAFSQPAEHTGKAESALFRHHLVGYARTQDDLESGK